MERLKLSGIEDDKPVKLTIELPANVHRDLIAYGDILGREAGLPAIQPAKLIGPMLARFMATDRAFLKRRAGGDVLANPTATPKMRTKHEPNPDDCMTSGRADS